MDSFERVFSHIHAERVISLASELIRIPSVNPPGNEEEAAQWAGRFMTNIGMEVSIQPIAPRRANVIGRLKGSGTGRGLLFSGHLDVVPVSQEERPAWQTDPFVPLLKEGRLCGRGAVDAKGGAAAVLCAVEAIKEAGTPLAGDVWVVLSADEEGAMLGVKKAISSGILQGVQAAVVAEPSENRLCLCSKGQTYGWITMYGQTAHTSIQGAGVNAVHAAARFIERLLGRRPTHSPHPALGESWWTVTMIHGGVGESIVPDSCGLSVDGRLVPGQSAQQFWDDVEAVLREMADADESFSASISIKGEAAPWETPPDSPLAQILLRAIRIASNREAEVTGYPATTDGNYFFSQLSIPVAILGPGALSSCHGANECVPEEQLVESARIYAASALEYCGTASEAEKASGRAHSLPLLPAPRL